MSTGGRPPNRRLGERSPPRYLYNSDDEFDGNETETTVDETECSSIDDQSIPDPPAGSWQNPIDVDCPDPCIPPDGTRAGFSRPYNVIPSEAKNVARREGKAPDDRQVSSKYCMEDDNHTTSPVRPGLCHCPATDRTNKKNAPESRKRFPPGSLTIDPKDIVLRFPDWKRRVDGPMIFFPSDGSSLASPLGRVITGSEGSIAGAFYALLYSEPSTFVFVPLEFVDPLLKTLSASHNNGPSFTEHNSPLAGSTAPSHQNVTLGDHPGKGHQDDPGPPEFLPLNSASVENRFPDWRERLGPMVFIRNGLRDDLIGQVLLGADEYIEGITYSTVRYTDCGSFQLIPRDNVMEPVILDENSSSRRMRHRRRTPFQADCERMIKAKRENQQAALLVQKRRANHRERVQVALKKRRLEEADAAELSNVFCFFNTRESLPVDPSTLITTLRDYRPLIQEASPSQAVPTTPEGGVEQTRKKPGHQNVVHPPS